MKCLFLSILLFTFFCRQVCIGQTAAEWFNQKKTQKKYLIAQIAALQTYIAWLKDGYKIANGGLTTISKIKDGDISVHTLFFNDLKRLNPSLQKNRKLLDLALAQLSLYQYCKDIRWQLRVINALPANQLTTVDRLYGQFIAQIGEDVFSFIDIISNTAVNMNDFYRLKMIDQLYNDFQTRKVFIQHVSDQLLSYASANQRDETEISNFRKLY
ncbi:hypothetical protein [Chitinophaga varians]|uniref:hypothetical protein n=1 Tax=Chitinophaga varians TaxID=2202339 RepID=UPI00165F2AC9|nr:hypothetical protein [Chitinophaga varians]MBC9909119.1 hypothetical protein [Chitinophaga varians]